jgi:hypothetical protein
MKRSSSKLSDIKHESKSLVESDNYDENAGFSPIKIVLPKIKTAAERVQNFCSNLPNNKSVDSHDPLVSEEKVELSSSPRVRFKVRFNGKCNLIWNVARNVTIKEVRSFKILF